MVADDIVPRSLALREAGLKRRAGLACPVPLEKIASFFVPRRLPKPPRQSVVHDDTRVIRTSVLNTDGTTDDSVATDGPHRPTVGSRPWNSPAKERAAALAA